MNNVHYESEGSQDAFIKKKKDKLDTSKGQSNTSLQEEYATRNYILKKNSDSKTNT